MADEDTAKNAPEETPAVVEETKSKKTKTKSKPKTAPAAAEDKSKAVAKRTKSPAKTSKAGNEIAKRADGGEKKARHTHPGTKVRLEILKAQENTDRIGSRKRFDRFLHIQFSQRSINFMFKDGVKETLQRIGIAYLERLCRSVVATVSNRAAMTMKSKDVDCVNEIKEIYNSKF